MILNELTEKLVNGNALNRIGTVHFGRFMFLEPFATRSRKKDLRKDIGWPSKYALFTTYDGALDDYVLDFVHDDGVGMLFNLILNNIDIDEERYPDLLPVQNDPLQFVKFIHDHDLSFQDFTFDRQPYDDESSELDLGETVDADGNPVITFSMNPKWYSAYPNMTVRDVWNAHHWRDHALELSAQLQDFRVSTKDSLAWGTVCAMLPSLEPMLRSIDQFMEETSRPMDYPTSGGENNRQSRDDKKQAAAEPSKVEFGSALRSQYQAELARLMANATTKNSNDNLADLQLHEIQGNLLHPSLFARTRHVFLRFNDSTGAKSWLKTLLPDVSTAEETSNLPNAVINISFTYAGLEALDVDPLVLRTCSREFRSGGLGQADWIGDVGINAPQNWQSKFRPNECCNHVHCVLSIHARTAPGTDPNKFIEDKWNEIQPSDNQAMGFIEQDDSFLLPEDKEHFGFVDGISQPIVDTSQTNQEAYRWNSIPVGEFIHGYPGINGAVVFGPSGPGSGEALGSNGTYLVLRKLKQDVFGFRQFIKQAATKMGITPDHFAAKLMGRWQDGTPLIDHANKPNSRVANDTIKRNDFGFEDDPDGLECPRGSHIRRMNPRDDFSHRIQSKNKPLSHFHRIIRTGKPYGEPLPENATEDDKIDRGLIFVAVNADISRQFEFLQNAWANGGDDLGLDPGSLDPIIGSKDTNDTNTPDEKDRDRTVIFPRRTPPIQQFVTTRYSFYLFAPGISGLSYLLE